MLLNDHAYETYVQSYNNNYGILMLKGSGKAKKTFAPLWVSKKNHKTIP